MEHIQLLRALILQNVKDVKTSTLMVELLTESNNSNDSDDTVRLDIPTDLLGDVARLLEQKIEKIEKQPSKAVVVRKYNAAMDTLDKVRVEIEYLDAREDENSWSMSSYENPYD